MKFLDELKKVLASDKRFIGENNQIIKTKVSDAARTNDKKLLRALLSNGLLKEAFFTKVDDIYVFDKNKFVWVLDSKEFLPDSFTMYKNKIGLVDSNNNLISQKQDVSLVWPYKDCVLEGGQTKEDQKRDEIFYNETLAPDQVNRLLSPKVLANAKRYTKDGIEENIEFNEDDNLIIKGNNLLALSSLLERYEGKINCIYIDPPYNPDSAANTFAYNNKFNHSTWLTFMKNRANLSKKLLSKDGVFCCSIDHNELFYLGVLFDEIFGRENRIGLVSVETNPGGRSDSTFFATSSEYFIIYAKNIVSAVINDITKNEKKLDAYNKEDEISKYKLVPLRRTGSNSTPDKRPNLCYPIFYNKKTKAITVENHYGKENWIEMMPLGTDKMRVWRWSKSKLMDSLDDIEVTENRSNNEFDIYVKDRFNNKEKAKTMWYASKYDASANGTKVLQKLNLNGEFSYPKSVYLIKDILEILTDEKDTVLDFHLGSGTTAAVAHKMGRRYIGIEQMDYIEDISVERLKKVIEGEQGGISKDVDWQGGGSFVYCELLEDNESLVTELEKATTSTDIKVVLNKAMDNGKLIPSVLPSDLKENEDDFDKLSLDEQKNLVMELLNKNQLYINLSDIDDVDSNVNEADKKFTKSFYNMEKF